MHRVTQAKHTAYRPLRKISPSQIIKKSTHFSTVNENSKISPESIPLQKTSAKQFKPPQQKRLPRCCPNHKNKHIISLLGHQNLRQRRKPLQTKTCIRASIDPSPSSKQPSMHTHRPPTAPAPCPPRDAPHLPPPSSPPAAGLRRSAPADANTPPLPAPLPSGGPWVLILSLPAPPPPPLPLPLLLFRDDDDHPPEPGAVGGSGAFRSGGPRVSTRFLELASS